MMEKQHLRLVNGQAVLSRNKLLALAEEQGLYIHQDPELLERLAVLQDGDPIPPALFVIIAEILAYSYVLQGKMPEHLRRADGTTAIDVKS